MVEQVVAALSGFRQAARDANDNVRQLLSGIMPSASRANESSKELSDTARAGAQSDSDTRSASNKAASVAEETASLGEQILNELKEFSKKFTTLISGEGGSFVDSIFGMGLGGAGLTALSSLSGGNDLSIDEPAYDLSYDPSNTAPYATEGGGEVVQSQAGIRNGPIDENLLNIISASAAEAGVNVNIISGGQMSLKAFNNAEGSKEVIEDNYYLNGKAVRTGSTRHDNGGAADLDLLDPNTGQKLEYNNETQHIFHNFMTLTKQYGATGIGFGFGRNDGYMGGDRMHIGFGADAFWGEVHEDEGTIAAAIESITPGSKSLPEPNSEPTPSAAEDEISLGTQAQETNDVTQVARNDVETNDVTQVARNDVETNDVTQVARNDVETNAQQPAEITRASFSNLETSGISEKPTLQSAALDISPIVNSPPLVELQSSEIPPVSLAMADAKDETVKQEKPNLRSAPAVDLSSQENNYKTKRGLESSIASSPPLVELQSSEIPPVSLAMADAKDETVKQETQTFQSEPAVDLSSQENNYKIKSGLESSIASSPSVAKLQSSEIPTVSLAMANAGVETVNFEREELELPRVDLTPATTSPSQTAALSGANISSPVVTQAASYVAPQESSVVSTGLPNTKKPKPLVVNFDTDWIAIANGTKRETNKTWMA